MDASATQRSRQSQIRFKADLIAHYNAACSADQDMARCLVTSQYIQRRNCIAAHILPHGSWRLLQLYNIPGLVSVNDVQNGILWAGRIEQAYTAGEVCMIYNPFTSSLEFVVLHNGLMDQGLGVFGQDVDMNGNPVELTFLNVHCKALEIPPGKMPSLRLLLSQAIFAMDLATERGWPRPANFEYISRLLDAMRDAVSRMVADGEEDSSEFLEQWAEENRSQF